MTSPFTARLHDRRATLADESAFTLVEFLIVVLILGILLAIAVPAYLNFEGKSQSTAAAANVREAISDASAYFAENNSYAGMGPSSLRSTYDAGLIISSKGSNGIVSVKPDGTGQAYCISAVSGGRWAHDSGPGGTIVADPSSVTADPCL